jgi:hypothetical protein
MLTLKRRIANESETPLGKFRRLIQEDSKGRALNVVNVPRTLVAGGSFGRFEVPIGEV